MTTWRSPQAIGIDDWRRTRATLLAEMAREHVFAPHYKLAVQRGFDRVRAAILAGRPLRAPSPYAYLRHEPDDGDGGGFSERPDAVLGPVERTLFLLFATAAAATAEPHLDRGRVFSALPARPGEQLLLANTDWCAGCYAQTTGSVVADDRWPHLVEIDVARAGSRLRRAALLADLRRLGLPSAWQAAGDRIDQAIGQTIGADGVLGDLMTSGTLVTLSLRPLDRLFADRGHPSFRLIDGMIVPAAEPAAAEETLADLAAALAGMGLALNPRKSRIVAREKLLAEWSGPSPHLDTRHQSEAEAGRDVLGRLDTFGKDAFKVEQAALLALGRARDSAALDRALSRFVAAPWAARIYALYIGLFLDDTAVRARFETMLHADFVRLHPWQRMWGLSALWTAPAISPRVGPLLARTAGDAGIADPVRAAAAIVWARFATTQGWDVLETVAGGSRSSHLRAAIAFGFRYRSAAARQTTLATWARLDPHVDLVATAVERDLAAPPGMTGAEAGA